MRKSVGWWGLLLWALAAPVAAQQAETATGTGETVSPRFGLRYTTEGAGYDPFASLEAFLPLFETPGSNLTFMEGRLLLSSKSALGGSAVLGYRSYSPSSNRILGGYLAYDVRDTGESIFNQIGAGFESLGDDWDIRANAYIPVGNTRNQISESFGAAFFQQNSLRLQRVRQFEAAMTGGDVEAGGRLLALGDGDLRGYAGVYYYSAEGSDGVFGVRARLIARPTDYLGLSVSVQNDRLTDTSVVLSAAVSFPGSRPRGVKTPSALARIGESVERQTAIIADEQRKTDTVAASLPDSRNPLRFLHVSLGSGTGTGSFEKPFGSVAEALGAAQSGDIVYLQSGSNPGVPGFKIPDGVSVLSTAPVQQIDTAQRSAVVLPLSGTGALPAVTGTVTLGNNSTVSGLAISVPDDGSADTRNPGIAGSNTSNPTIRHSTISSSDGSGISLNGVSGQLEIASNTISNSAGDGIRINITGTSTVRSATIANNTISNSRSSRGIRVDTLDSSQLQQVSISQNTIAGSRFQGIAISPLDSSQIQDISITANRVTNSGAAGILIAPLNNSRVERASIDSNIVDASDAQGIWVFPHGSSQMGQVSISSNQITNSGLNRNPIPEEDLDFTGSLNGIEINTEEESEGSTIERVFVQGNRIDRSAEDGITFIGATISNPTLRDNTVSNSGEAGILLEGTRGQLEIAGNTVSNSGTDGIRASVTGAEALTAANISRNTVSASGRRGIRLDAQDTSQVQQLSVAENSVTGSFFQGILVNSGGSSTLGQVSIASNRISDSGAAGILASLGENSRTEQVAIESNTIDSSDAQGIWILPSGSARAGSVTIRSNTISNSGLNRNPTSNPDFDFTGFLNGIEVSAEDSEGGGIQRLLIESNRVGTSAENGISIKAATSLRLLSGVRLNTITGSGNFGAVAETVKTGNLCLQLRENTSDRGLQLRQTSGTLQVEDALSTNAGAVSTSGTITTVPQGTCQVP